MSSLTCFTVEEGRGVGPGPDMSQGGELGGGSNEELLLSVAKPVERARDRFTLATCLFCWSVQVLMACYFSIVRRCEPPMLSALLASGQLQVAWKSL